MVAAQPRWVGVCSTPLGTTEGWRRADIGAGNGHGNARSLPRLQSAVACGGEVDSVRLLSPKTIDRIFEVQFNGIDLVIGIPIKWGVGYGLAPEGRVCSWGGAGGSLVMIDVDRRITFAYVMNKMAPVGGVIVAALAERVKDIVNPSAGLSERAGEVGPCLTRSTSRFAGAAGLPRNRPDGMATPSGRRMRLDLNDRNHYALAISRNSGMRDRRGDSEG